jgi:hypothetical protein
MFSIVIVLFLTYSLTFTSTALVTIYQNAQFDPSNIHFKLEDLSYIESIEACICECSLNPMCITASYTGYNQSCSLYFAQLEQGQLQLMTIDTNSSVITFRNITIPGK